MMGCWLDCGGVLGEVGGCWCPHLHDAAVAQATTVAHDAAAVAPTQLLIFGRESEGTRVVADV